MNSLPVADKYKEMLLSKNISDKNSFLLLTKEKIKTDFSEIPLGPRKKLLHAIEKMTVEYFEPLLKLPETDFQALIRSVSQLRSSSVESEDVQSKLLLRLIDQQRPL